MKNSTTSDSKQASMEAAKAVDSINKNSSNKSSSRPAAESKAENKAGNKPESKTAITDKPVRATTGNASKAPKEDDRHLIVTYQSRPRVWPD